MSGQATVTIGGSSWVAYFANMPTELAQGLGGVASMDAGTGMLFDTGYDHLIGVTTEQMLFNLDIAFISSGLKVVEIRSNLAPGNIITGTEQARYFLEVNATELAGVSIGDNVDIEITGAPAYVVGPTISADDIFNMVAIVLPMVIVGGLGIGMVRSVMGGDHSNPDRGGMVYGRPPVAPISRERRARLRRLPTHELKRRYSELTVLQSTEPDPDRALEIAGIKEILWERGYPEYAR